MILNFPKALIDCRSKKGLKNLKNLPNVCNLSPNWIKNDVNIFINFLFEYLDIVDVKANIDYSR